MPLRIEGALLRGTAAALLGGGTAWLLAVFLPGSAVLTALAGMAAGGILSLVIVWPEARQVFTL